SAVTDARAALGGFSAARRSTTRPGRPAAGLPAAARASEPFRPDADLAAENVFPFFRATPAGGTDPPRPPSVLRALADGFRMFAAPADPLRDWGVEHFADFLDELFGEARLRHEPVAPGLLGAFGDAGQGV